MDVVVAPVEVWEMRSLEFEESGFSQGSAGYFEVDVVEFDGAVFEVAGGVEVDVVVARIEVGGDGAGRGEQAGGVGGQGQVAVSEEADFGEIGAAPEDGVDRHVQAVGCAVGQDNVELFQANLILCSSVLEH